MINKKENYIGILKIMSIISIILLSIISNSLLNVNKTLILINTIFIYGIPILIMCIGKEILNRNFNTKHLLKKALKLYILLVFWNTTYNILYDTFIKKIFVNTDMIINYLKDSILLNTSYQFWILPIIIMLYLLTPLLNKIINLNNKILDTLFVIILSLIFGITSFYNISYFPYFLGYILYYYLGYYLNKYEFKKINYIFYIFGIILILLTYKYTVKYSFIDNKINMTFINYLNINIIIISTSLFIFVKQINKYIKNIKLMDIISTLSKQVFGIYLIYGLILELINKSNIVNYNNINISDLFGTTVLTYLLCIICSIWLNYLPFVDKLVKERF